MPFWAASLLIIIAPSTTHGRPTPAGARRLCCPHHGGAASPNPGEMWSGVELMGADGISSTGRAVVSAVIAAAAGVAVWRSILAGRQAREARKSRELSAII